MRAVAKITKSKEKKRVLRPQQAAELRNLVKPVQETITELREKNPIRNLQEDIGSLAILLNSPEVDLNSEEIIQKMERLLEKLSTENYYIDLKGEEAKRYLKKLKKLLKKWDHIINESEYKPKVNNNSIEITRSRSTAQPPNKTELFEPYLPSISIPHSKTQQVQLSTIDIKDIEQKVQESLDKFIEFELVPSKNIIQDEFQPKIEIIDLEKQFELIEQIGSISKQEAAIVYFKSAHLAYFTDHVEEAGSWLNKAMELTSDDKLNELIDANQKFISHFQRTSTEINPELIENVLGTVITPLVLNKITYHYSRHDVNSTGIVTQLVESSDPRDPWEIIHDSGYLPISNDFYYRVTAIGKSASKKSVYVIYNASKNINDFKAVQNLKGCLEEQNKLVKIKMAEKDYKDSLVIHTGYRFGASLAEEYAYNAKQRAITINSAGTRIYYSQSTFMTSTAKIIHLFTRAPIEIYPYSDLSFYGSVILLHTYQPYDRLGYRQRLRKIIQDNFHFCRDLEEELAEAVIHCKDLAKRNSYPLLYQLDDAFKKGQDVSFQALLEELNWPKGSNLNKEKVMESTRENTIVGFYRSASSLVPTTEQLQLMAQNPTDYQLVKNGICHTIIKAKVEGLSDEAITERVANMDMKKFSIETDKAQNTALHWASTLDYPQLGNFLARKMDRNSTNELGLTPNQMAAVVGSKQFLISQLEQIAELKDLTITITDLQGKTVNIKLNELHLSMFIGLDVTKAVFQTFENKHKQINPEITGVGNLLHLTVYIADVERSKDQPPITALNLLDYILTQQFRGKTIAGLLTEKANNHDDLTPLALAAAHGHVGLVKRLIDYLILHVEEGQGLQEVEIAFCTAALHGQDAVMEMLSDYYQFVPQVGDMYTRTFQQLLEKVKTDATYNTTLNLFKHIAERSRQIKFLPPDSKTQVFETLVLAGGGGKGLGFPFILYALKTYCDRRSQRAIEPHLKEALGFNRIKRVIGTSAGAIFATGLSIGHSIERMLKLVDYDYSLFLESDHLNTIVKELNQKDPSIMTMLEALLKQLQVKVEEVKGTAEYLMSEKTSKLRKGFEIARHAKGLYHELLGLIQKIREIDKNFKGFSTGKVAYQFIADLFNEVNISPTITFGELATLVHQQPDKYKHLHIVVTNLTQGHFEVLSTENPVYTDYLVLPAVRCSMAYPVVFETYHLEMKTAGRIIILPDEYVDGGALRNYALEECDFKKYTSNADYTGDPNYPEINKKTLGICFKESISAPARPSDQAAHPLLAKIMEFANLFIQAEALIREHSGTEYSRSIIFDTENITTFTFRGLKLEEKHMLAANSLKAIEVYSKEILPQSIFEIPDLTVETGGQQSKKRVSEHLDVLKRSSPIHAPSQSRPDLKEEEMDEQDQQKKSRVISPSGSMEDID